MGLLKAKMYPEGCKIEEYPKILLNGPNTLSKYINISFKNFLDILKFCVLLGTFWPLKGQIFKVLPYLELKIVKKVPLDPVRVFLALQTSASAI